LLENRGEEEPVDDFSSPPALGVLLVGIDGAEGEHIADLLAQSSAKFALDRVGTVADAVESLVRATPSCILLELSAIPSEAIAAVDELAAAASSVPIVVLADDEDEGQALAAIRAGAQDYLVKSELASTRLCRAIKCAIERKLGEVGLMHQAMHDSLTGLPNRALFMDRLSLALERSQRIRTGVAVLFLDVDNFKEINDNLGHAAGDAVLTELAARLKTMLRPMDTVARLGGDEFTFLIEDLGDEREIVMIADRISRAANLPIALERGPTAISVSIGIAMVTGQSVTAETLIREADAAMYRSKHQGQGGYELFDERSRSRTLERMQLETALGRALERSELRVHYQPGVALGHRGEVSSLEALVRWEHPEHGLIAPSQFIPLAEETGLIVPIGRYVLEHALAHLELWRRQVPGVTVSVNLSPRQLADLELADMLADMLGEHPIEPAALCLEIQESTIGKDPESIAAALAELKATGVRLAIDDFGIAPSSLTRLKSLPIDTIKLHGSLVSEIDSDPRERPIVEAVVELGHALGCGVVAEGVETPAQAEALRAIGCDGAQGFLFAPPVPEELVERLLVNPGGAGALPEIAPRPVREARPGEGTAALGGTPTA
jgi:diguanylate cyclase (GGDEF)-like protein